MTTRPVGFPSPTTDPQQVAELLRALREATEIGQRVRGDKMKSYVRLEELVQLGLADSKGSLLTLPDISTSLATGFPATSAEITYGAPVLRKQYLPGDLRRYTNDNGTGVNITSAWNAMLNSGEKLCFVPGPITTWGIASTVIWPAGVTVRCGRGCSITSSVAAGQWTFRFMGIPYALGAGFYGFILNVVNVNAKGIQLWETRNTRIAHFDMVGPAGIGGHGIEVNGGDDASPTWGSAHNFIEDGRVYRMASGIRFYTDNTTTPGSNTAFCNRNWVIGVQAQSCTEGLFTDRANTNWINMSLQANVEGADIGTFAKNNAYILFPENNTRPIVLSTSADENHFGGDVRLTDFVDSGGAAVAPHSSVSVVSTNTMLLPRDVNVSSAGAIRFINPFDAGPIRLQAWQAGQSLRFCQRLAAGTNSDIAELTYDATAPFWTFLKPVRHGTSSGPLVQSGAGTPEGAITAPVGSLYHRNNGGAGTSVYIKESGAGNTGWVPIVSISDGDKGDITVSASGATWTIDNDVVTFAKMQNIATDRLIGRDTAASGDPEEVSVTNGLEFTGGPAIGIATAGVTLARMADLAQDQFIGRTTASTGVPQTATITSAARTVLDDTTVAAMLATMGGAPLASPTFTGTVNLPGSTIIAAGSASASSWPKMTSGTVMTTAEDGAIELDADCFYMTTDAGNRGYVPVRHLIRADATRTFTSNTSQQAIFTTPANGTLTLETGTYQFEGMIAMTSMSATSGNGKFSILGAGSATIAAILWQAQGIDAAAEAAAAATGGGWHTIATQTAVDIVTAATATALSFTVYGSFEVTGAGTIIPSFAQTTAAAAIVSIGSFLTFNRIGSTTVTSVGQWS